MSSGFGSLPFGYGPFGEALDEDDPFPPFIGSWSPFPGAELHRLDVISFEVTDNSGVVATELVTASFPAGVGELIWNGAFATTYVRGSRREPIENGYRFHLRRTGGWPSSSVRLNVTATDVAGNVGTGQAYFP